MLVILYKDFSDLKKKMKKTFLNVFLRLLKQTRFICFVNCPLEVMVDMH